MAGVWQRVSRLKKSFLWVNNNQQFCLSERRFVAFDPDAVQFCQMVISETLLRHCRKTAILNLFLRVKITRTTFDRLNQKRPVVYGVVRAYWRMRAFRRVLRANKRCRVIFACILLRAFAKIHVLRVVLRYNKIFNNPIYLLLLFIFLLFLLFLVCFVCFILGSVADAGDKSTNWKSPDVSYRLGI